MAEEARRRLHRLLKRDLGAVVTKTGRGSWITTSNLPHEIRLHTDTAVDLVRVSAGVVIDVKPSKALLMDLNVLNTERALTRRIVVDRKVLLVAEMPVASLRKGDLEELTSRVFCCARLEAPGLTLLHGGRSVCDPPSALAPDVDRALTSWEDVLRDSGTATERELAVWIDGQVGGDCWIDRDEESVFVVIDGQGIGSTYPFCLGDLLEAARDRIDEIEDDD